MENVKYRVVGYTATGEKYVDHESRMMSFKSAKKLIESNLNNIKYYRFDLVKVVEEELIVLDTIYGFHTKEEVEKEYEKAPTADYYYINGYTVTGVERIRTDGLLIEKDTVNKMVKLLLNNIDYYQFDIVKVEKGVEKLCETVYSRYNKEVVELVKTKEYYKIFGRNGSMKLEEIYLKNVIFSVEEAQAIIQQLLDNKKYFEYVIMKKSPFGDEMLDKKYTIPSNYTFEEVHKDYLEENKTKDAPEFYDDRKSKEEVKSKETKIIKESKDILKTSTFIQKGGQNEQLGQNQVINFENAKRTIQKTYISKLEHINLKPGECLELQDAGKNNKFCSTKRGEKNRQKAKQKYLAMGGRR